MDIEKSNSDSERSVKEETAFHEGDLDRVQRRLSRNHVQMIAIAGTIGTGLFLGIGQILAVTGPLGMLLVYLHVASVIYVSMASIAEMTAFAPISGSFPHYAARWVDPALGFTIGWVGTRLFFSIFRQLNTDATSSRTTVMCDNGLVVTPTEITASTVLISFWDHNTDHTAIYVAIIIILTVAMNLFGVRFFGNSEIFFSTLKIMLIIGLIIGGLVVTSGGGPNHTSHGFEYWRNPGPFVSFLEPGARGRFVGMVVAIVPAYYSMAGQEIIAIAAAETVNPRRNIAIAMRTVFFRILLFYIVAVIIVGMLIPSNDRSIFQKASTAGQSPFVLAFSRAGIKSLPAVINAAILTSAFSAGNSSLFACSRILYGLAVRGHAPKFFAKCTSSGLPYVAILSCSVFSLLAFLNVGDNSSKVFGWFVNLTAVGGLLGLGTMNLTYLRYYYGLKAQGITPGGIYRFCLQPYAAMWGCFWVTFYILISGISIFWTFNVSDFVAAYINLPLFGLLYVGFKIFMKTKMLPLQNLDFVTGIPTLEETEGHEESLQSSVDKIKALLKAWCRSQSRGTK